MMVREMNTMARPPLASLLMRVLLCLAWIYAGHAPFAAAQGLQKQNMAVSSCQPVDAVPLQGVDVGEDGILLLDGHTRIRLAGILWPDGEEKSARIALAERLTAAMAGQALSWRKAGEADRWGILPAHLFVSEPGSTLPPFWLQAGILEAGLAQGWPNILEKSCWTTLKHHESLAIRAKRGVWAPRAQSARLRPVWAAPEHHQGRRIVALWRVARVRQGRAITFVNLSRVSRAGASLWISQSMAKRLMQDGKDMSTWQSKWIIARFVVGSHGLKRIRPEAPDHVDILDEHSPVPTMHNNVAAPLCSGGLSAGSDSLCE
jgi:hypothetical protein